MKLGEGGPPPSEVMYSESREKGTWIDSSAIVDLVGMTVAVVTLCFGCCCCERLWSCDDVEPGEAGEGVTTVGRLYDACRACDGNAAEDGGVGLSFTTCKGGPRSEVTDEIDPLARWRLVEL